MTDIRPYFFSLINSNWSFIACGNEYISNVVPLEIWIRENKDEYVLCRACYDFNKAIDYSKNGPKHMMDSPDVYRVFKLNKNNDVNENGKRKEPENVCSVWVPPLLKGNLQIDIQTKHNIVDQNCTLENVRDQIWDLLEFDKETTTVQKHKGKEHLRDWKLSIEKSSVKNV